MLGTIEEEAQKCRARFIAAGTKIRDFVWCYHHGRELEILTISPEIRINYILKHKPERERARRLYEFRPVLGKLPDEMVEADKAWNEADKAMDKAYMTWFGVDKAMNKAHMACDKADKDWDDVCIKYQPEVTTLHKQEVPDTTWNGITIAI